MNNDSDSHAWANVAVAFAFWIAGHVTLSNVALTVSICVGVLQGYKTLREIARNK